MKRTIIGLVRGMLIAGGAAQAATSLAEITPRNIKSSTFQLFSNAGKDHTVEFVIRQDVRNIDLPTKTAFVSDAVADPKSVGTRVNAEEEGKTLVFRFSVPEAKVASSQFTLWGKGAAAKGVTYRFHLGDFWKPRKN